MTFARGDVGRTNNLCRRSAGIVIECISGKEHVLVTHLHIEVKDGQLRLRIVLTPIGDQRRLTVHHLATLKEVGIIVNTVEVQAIGVKCSIPVLQLHVISGHRQFVVTIVIGIIAEK